uniref:ZP domain-containing protein n=1 Tax=Panagrolaimus sp. PS1159 TaxID=55785 RepID=A0AC35G1U6_9BILA
MKSQIYGISTKTGFLFILFCQFISIHAIPIDNSILGDPTVNCLSDRLSVDLKTAKAFGGRVFVKGFSQDSNCNIVGNGASAFDFSINFDNCGLRRSREINGVSISATIVVSFHPIFITKVDRAYRLNCFYTESKKTLSQQLDVSELTTQLITRQTTMPICRYEILSDGPNGKPVKYARIGDHVYHKWTCDSESVGVYCMKVHTCIVTDGQGGEPITVLDQEGCEIDRFVLQNLDYSTDGLSAGKGAHVFKFADKPSLHFACQLSLSLKDQKSGCKFLQPQCGANGNIGGVENNYGGTQGSDNSGDNGYTSAGSAAASNPTPAYEQDKSATTVGYEANVQQPTATTRSRSSNSGTYDGIGTSSNSGYNNGNSNTYSNGNSGGYGSEQFPKPQQYQEELLPGANYKVLPDSGPAAVTPSTTPNGYDSGYTLKSNNAYDQTQVAPSSKVAETQYEEVTPTPTAYEQQTPSALVYNDFYQDETDVPIQIKKKSAKRHSVMKRKVADFDLPEQSFVVIEIDEDPLRRDAADFQIIVK